MARTIQEIQTQMQDNFMANAVLIAFYGFNQGDSFDDRFSQVSFERTLLFVIASSIWIVEKMQDQHVEWIENRAAELEFGQLPWYRKKALEFQFGDSLTFNGKDYVYDPVVEANQIVKLASATEANNVVLIKCATLDQNGEIVPLNTQQLDALREYFRKRKYGGVQLAVISRNPDLLKIEYHVYYDPLVMSSNGSLISDPSVFPVEDAINDYSKFMNNSFNAQFSITELTDQIQQAPGVVNPVFDAAEAKFGTQQYEPIIDFYTPNAGYLQIDPQFPLAGSITYIQA